jgi:hypothetical protein
MIPKKKKEYEPKPMELCPSFGRCSANMCPLDPDINNRIYVAGEDKCRATKPTRLKIAEKFPQLLPYKGFTKREWSGRRTWANRSPREKKKFIEANTKRLKKLNNN